MSRTLVNVVFHGSLRKKFGKGHPYAIACPAEAVKACCATIKGFRDHLSKISVRVLVGEKETGFDRIFEISGGQDIHIVPVVAGAKKSALGQIITGAALIAAVYFTGGMAGEGFSMTGTSWLSSVTINIGAAMMLGGVASLLASAPNPRAYDAGNEDSSKNYLFSGSGQPTRSGGCVPVVYGRVGVPLVPISTRIMGGMAGSSRVFRMGGSGGGVWSGDGNTVPLVASIWE